MIIKDSGYNAGYWLLYDISKDVYMTIERGVTATFHRLVQMEDESLAALINKSYHFSMWVELFGAHNLGDANVSIYRMVPCYDGAPQPEFSLSLGEFISDYHERV